MGNKSPCKACPDRCPGCHSKCEKYIKFRQELTELTEAIHKQKHIEHISIRRIKK